MERYYSIFLKEVVDGAEQELRVSATSEAEAFQRVIMNLKKYGFDYVGFEPDKGFTLYVGEGRNVVTHIVKNIIPMP